MANIEVLPNGPTATTTDSGHFTVGPLSAGAYTLRFRRLGYRMRTVTIDAPPSGAGLTITMEPVPTELDTVFQSSLKDELPRVFDRMRAHIGAAAFGPELMKEFPGFSVDDMLRLDSDLWHQLLGESFCGMAIYLDGKPLPPPPLRSGHADRGDHGIRLQVPMRDIAAIEAFRTLTGVHEPWLPKAVNPESCTRTVMIWTKGYHQVPYKGP